MSWNIQNADEVHLSSVGLVNPFDTRSVRVPDDQKELPYFRFTILASQHKNSESQEKQIAIKNSLYRDPSAQQISRDIPTLSPEKTNKSIDDDESSEEKGAYQWSGYLIAICMFLLIIIFIYILHSINPII